jgi:hypothetical protein
MHIDLAYTERLAELTMYARLWWIVAATSLVLLTALMIRLGRRFSLRRAADATSGTPASILSRFQQDQSATASMEYLLVLFPFLVIVMTVWQLAFMINAQMHVSYSAYAAARSASVLIPADLKDEKEGLLKNRDAPGATKWARIHDAAIPGTLAISPGDLGTAGGVAVASKLRRGGIGTLGGLPNPASIAGRFTLMTAHHTDPGIFSGTRFLRGQVKNQYAERMTDVHVNSQDQTKTQDLEGVERVEVTVNYVFWLHVPYVGRLLEAMFEGYQNPVTGEYFLLNPYPSMVLSETITMTSWPRKRAIEPCN